MHISSNDLRPGEEPECFWTIIRTPKRASSPCRVSPDTATTRPTVPSQPTLPPKAHCAVASIGTNLPAANLDSIHHPTYSSHWRIFKFHTIRQRCSHLKFLRRRTTHLPKSLHSPDQTEVAKATMPGQVECISSPLAIFSPTDCQH